MDKIRRTPPHLKLSFWLTLAGFIPGRIGASFWTFLGAASFGISWDRSTGCVIGQWRPGSFDKHFAFTHYPFFFLGLARLWRYSR